MALKVTVAIPAYNEAENLALILPKLKSSLNDIGKPYQILIIDRVKATDETAQICNQHAVTHINRKPSDSYGDAVRSAIAAAEGDRLLFMDADGSHDPEFIKQLIAQEDFDIVIASRYTAGGGSHVSGGSIAMSRLLNSTFTMTFGLKCSDVSNSFKLYRTDLLKSLSLQCDNFDIILEILVKMLRQKPDLTIKEIPFHFQQRIKGTTKRQYVKFITSYLQTLIRLRTSA